MKLPVPSIRRSTLRVEHLHASGCLNLRVETSHTDFLQPRRHSAPRPLIQIVLAVVAVVSLATAAGVVRAQQPIQPPVQPVPDAPSAEIDPLGARRVPIYPECPVPGDPATTPIPLSQIRVAMPIQEGEVPADCSGNLFSSRPSTGGLDIGMQFYWRPTNFFHQPLYFDDQPLERYGQTHNECLQPVVSGAKFFATFPIIPYKMGFNGTHDCVTTLGYYRPGNCAPCQSERFPFTVKGALLETGTALGMVFCLP